MASGPITSWQIDGEKIETVTDFIFLGSKITMNGNCSHETKRHLLPGRKAMTDLDSILKSRDIILLTKVCQSYSFSSSHVQRWDFSPWRKLGAQELMLSNCDAREDSWESLGLQGDQTNQSWRKSTLNIHWKDWGWSWSSNTLATWCKELTQKDPDAGKDWKQEREGDDKGWEAWMALLIQRTWIWANCGR